MNTYEKEIENLDKLNPHNFYDDWIYTKIKSPKVINLVKNIIQDVFEDNFFKATSSTGKYHPAYQNLKYGNVLHTKSLLKNLEVFEKARPDLDWDCLYAAGILHDCTKYVPDSIWADKNHPTTCKKKILEKAENLNDPIAKKISFLVEYHSGRWTENFNPKKMTEESWVLHYSDMLSASKSFKEPESFQPE